MNQEQQGPQSGSDSAPPSGGGGNSGEGKDPPQGLYPPSKENQSPPAADAETGEADSDQKPG